MLHLCEHFSIRNARAKRTHQNFAKTQKSLMMRLFLCDVRQQKRSIVNLCEEFDYRSAVQKELIRTIPPLKIVNDEIIFVRRKATKAQHSKPM